MVTLDQIMQRPVVVELSHGDNGARLSEGFEGANRDHFRNLNLRWCVSDVMRTFHSDPTVSNNPLLVELAQAMQGGYVLDVYGMAFEPHEDALARDHLREARDAQGNLFYKLEVKVFSDLAAAGMQSERRQEGGGMVSILSLPVVHSSPALSLLPGTVDRLVGAYERDAGVELPQIERPVGRGGAVLRLVRPGDGDSVEVEARPVGARRQEQSFFDEIARLEQERETRQVESRRQEELELLQALELKVRDAWRVVERVNPIIARFVDPMLNTFEKVPFDFLSPLDKAAKDLFVAKAVLDAVRSQAFDHRSPYEGYSEAHREHAQELYDKCETISDKRSSGAQINLLQKLVERATLEPFFYRKRLGSPDYSMIVDLMEEAGEVVAFDIFGRMKSSDLVGYFKWNQHFDTVCRISYSSKIAPSALRMDGFGHPHIATLGSQPGCERYVCSRAYKQAVRRAPNGQPKLRK